MKLSENTLNILKNFSSINSGIVFREGNIQKTIAPDNSILVEAEFEDSIPHTFGVYDLNQFLGSIATLNNPELTFSNNSVTMDDGDISFKYYSASPNTIVSPPEGKQLVVKNIDASFTLTNNILQKILRLSAMNNFPHFSMIAKDGEIRLNIYERSTDTTNVASLKIADYDGEDFDKTLKIDNLKFIPDDYTVDVIIPGFIRFTSKNMKIKYYVAFETRIK